MMQAEADNQIDHDTGAGCDATAGSLQRPVHRGGKLRGLLAINAALLMVMAIVTFAPSAGAQAGRARGEYLMVSGYINGSEPQVVFIVDAINQQMVAVRYRQDLKVLEGVSARNLRTDASDIAGGQFRAGSEGARRGNMR